MTFDLIRSRLLAWYQTHRRRLPWRATKDPYAIWISEAMLQQTQVATVIPYYHRFMERFPSPGHLAAADLQEVLKLWEGLGYYSRARNLHRAAKQVVAEHGGQLPGDAAALRALPGIGDYTAAAISSIAFGQVVPVVDGNVKRVLARLFEMDTPVNASSAHARYVVPASRLISAEAPADFNQAIMELGALVCRPRHPDCAACPLEALCQANLHGTTDRFPKRLAPQKRPHRHLVYGVIVKNETFLMVRRPRDGFLGGLWEFPAIASEKAVFEEEELAEALCGETGVTVTVDRHLGVVRHGYTHFTLSADVYRCQYVSGQPRFQDGREHRWLTLGELAELPSHKAIHKCLNFLEKGL